MKIKYYIFGYSIVHNGQISDIGDGVVELEVPCTALGARRAIKESINRSLLDNEYRLSEINLTLLKEWNEN